jgi:GTP-binding protein
MRIKEALFVSSHTELSKCPEGDKPEYAVIGRSNVGKSSLINYICNRKGLAKVSSTPGKTQLLNFFDIDTRWWLVDLPGYGYARNSKSKRADWSKMTKRYLTQREQLYCTFVLIDSRIPPQAIDLQFIEWLGEKELPFALVFTKADKRSSPETSRNIATFKNEMLKTWDSLPEVFITSSEKKLGKEELLNYISQINQEVLAAD